MKATGIYKVINFEQTDVTQGTPETITGIYDNFESNDKNVLCITGLSINGDVLDDAYIQAKKDEDDNYVFTAFGYTVTVNDEDEVDVAEALDELEDTALLADVIEKVNEIIGRI